MRVSFDDLESVVRPWAGRRGFTFSAASIEGDERACVESADGRTVFEVYALDGFGNVAVDIVRGAGGVRHAYTGPAPDLLRMLEEAHAQSEVAVPPRTSELN